MPIEDLRVGDSVFCVSLVDGSHVVTTITEVRRARRSVLELVHPHGSLRCTVDHPLYSPERREYVEAVEWERGNLRELLMSTQGDLVRVLVTEARTLEEDHEVFDLTVADSLHNFVAEGILVHNKSPADTDESGDGDGDGDGDGTGDGDGDGDGAEASESCMALALAFETCEWSQDWAPEETCADCAYPAKWVDPLDQCEVLLDSAEDLWGESCRDRVADWLLCVAEDCELESGCYGEQNTVALHCP